MISTYPPAAAWTSGDANEVTQLDFFSARSNASAIDLMAFLFLLIPRRGPRRMVVVFTSALWESNLRMTGSWPYSDAQSKALLCE